MKRLLALLVVATTPAVAQVGPLTTDMSCGQTRGLIAARGAMVLRTGAITYDRFVAHAGFCLYNEQATLAWVPTRDTRECPVSICREVDRWRVR